MVGSLDISLRPEASQQTEISPLEETNIANGPTEWTRHSWSYPVEPNLLATSLRLSSLSIKVKRASIVINVIYTQLTPSVNVSEIWPSCRPTADALTDAGMQCRGRQPHWSPGTSSLYEWGH